MLTGYDVLHIAVDAHVGQFRFNGDDYIQHPMRVAVSLLQDGFGDDYIAAALLHDVIEDTNVNDVILQKFGVKDKVIEAVLSMTKKKGESYEEYLYRVAANKISRVVKQYDIMDNMNPREIKTQKQFDFYKKKAPKYTNALRFLRSYNQTIGEILA